MIDIRGKNISIPRGDIGSVTFKLIGDISTGDTVRMLIGKDTYHESIIRKEGTVGNDSKVSFGFSGSDTDIQPGKYLYTLRVVKEHGYDTPIIEAEFIVKGAMQ